MSYTKSDIFGRGPRLIVHPAWASEYDGTVSQIEELAETADKELRYAYDRLHAAAQANHDAWYPQIVAYIDTRHKKLSEAAARLQAATKAMAWLGGETAKLKSQGKPPSTIAQNKGIEEVDGLSFLDAQNNVKELLQNLNTGLGKLKKEDGL